MTINSAEHTALLWVVFSVVLFLIELAAAPGVGLFLAGIGGFATAIAIATRLVPVDSFLQFTLFFSVTLLATALLWRPLARFRAGRNRGASTYHDVVGERATVRDTGLGAGRTGTVDWSGTVMRAELDAAYADLTLPAGSPVTVVAVRGTTFIVKPHS